MESGLVSRLVGCDRRFMGFIVPMEDVLALSPNSDMGYPWWTQCRQSCHGYLCVRIYHNYKKALADYTKIAGSIPLPPDYVFGYWYSKYVLFGR